MADLGNVQAIVARSSAKPLIAVLLFKLGAGNDAKLFLREWTANMTLGMAPDIDGQPAFYFLFSWSGMAALLAGHPQLDVAQGSRELETFFVDPVQAPGGQAVAAQLGFHGDSAPDRWWDRQFVASSIDLAIHASFDTPEQKTEYLDRLRDSAARHGLQELVLPAFPDRALSGKRPAGGRLHFGYRDGITTPNIDWDDTGRPGTVDVRELVVGYPNDDYPSNPRRPGPWQDFARDGSYVGLAWIYQDVAGFNRFLKVTGPTAAPRADPDKASEWLAAKLMGRWRDGTPLARFPDGPPPSPALDDNFGYADDPLGMKCPLTAHIRVAYCRDQPMKFANQVRFPRGAPRLVRRGFSYGPPLAGVDDDGVDRGVVGLFCFARVNEQFYTVLRWLQKTDFSGAFKSMPNGLNAQDSLFGNRKDASANTQFHLARPGNAPLSLQLADFIRYKGVTVLFAPGAKALKTLAAD
jgi:deferrochelatase/peroxidase EfeB